MTIIRVQLTQRNRKRYYLVRDYGMIMLALRGHTTLIWYIKPLPTRSRDTVVGIATGYGLDDREVGVRVPVRSRTFSSPCLPDRLWGPPNFLSNGYRGPGCEADHSLPASAEVKKMWIYISTPPYAFMA
jgi:hypothetical protein